MDPRAHRRFRHRSAAIVVIRRPIWRTVRRSEADGSDRYFQPSWLPDDLMVEWLISKPELRARIAAQHARIRNLDGSLGMVERSESELDRRTENVWSRGPVLEYWSDADIADAYLVLVIGEGDVGYEVVVLDPFANLSEVAELDALRELERGREYLDGQFGDNPLGHFKLRGRYEDS
jgi:hypothetical protein